MENRAPGELWKPVAWFLPTNFPRRPGDIAVQSTLRTCDTMRSLPTDVLEMVVDFVADGWWQCGPAPAAWFGEPWTWMRLHLSETNTVTLTSERTGWQTAVVRHVQLSLGRALRLHPHHAASWDEMCAIQHMDRRMWVVPVSSSLEWGLAFVDDRSGALLTARELPGLTSWLCQREADGLFSWSPRLIGSSTGSWFIATPGRARIFLHCSSGCCLVNLFGGSADGSMIWRDEISFPVLSRHRCECCNDRYVAMRSLDRLQVRRTETGEIVADLAFESNFAVGFNSRQIVVAGAAGMSVLR